MKHSQGNLFRERPGLLLMLALAAALIALGIFT